MHIGIVLAATPGYSETFFHSKIRGLIAASHKVTLFTGRSDPKFNLCPVVLSPDVSQIKAVQLLQMLFSLFKVSVRAPGQVHRFYQLERRSGRTFRMALENLYLNSHILTYKLDWLHFGFSTMAIRRENVAGAIGAKMGVSLRGYDISIYPLKHPGCYQLLWQRVEKVHTISDALVQKAHKQGLSKEKSTVKITPAIDSNVFNKKVVGSEPIESLRLLTVGRLKWVKGLEYTLEALGELHKKGVNFKYTLIGEGEEYERLCFAAYQMGIWDKVAFKGKMAHSEIKKAMEQADIYLQYSLQEGFCNSVIEAQAMGLLCIVSDTEGLPENVLHGQTGWVVPKRRPELLTNQILEVVDMPESRRQEIRQKAIFRIRKEFNLEKQQKEFLKFYAD